ncbi:MAG TPA: sugar ABC transporter ATP-binding protein, partial [Anaerolineae bacterium]|nr:sugar ABC transporter ATP-binding protein [Anaerolineae bacterium]
MNATTPIIEFKTVSKNFGGVQALRQVSFAVPRGEIHALVGENGAGKSTLIRICGGVYPPSSGSLRFDGQEVQIRNVHEARAAGISIVHQEIPICPHLTAAENIFLGHALPKKGGLIDWGQVNDRAQALFAKLQVNLNPKTMASRLSIAQQQLVVIAQALSLNSKLLIMDEPTSALNKEETRHLFKILMQLRAQGLTVLYVSHKLEEVFEIADRITALRDGQYIDTISRAEATPDKIVHLMVGREVANVFPKTYHPPTDTPLLSAKNLTVPGLFENVSFELYGGEVLGLVGLQGSGTSEVLRAIFGHYPQLSGELRVWGKPVKFKSSLEAIKHGLAYVPADRQIEGLYPHLSVRDNAGLLLLRLIAKKLGWVSLGQLSRRIGQKVEQFNIRTASVNAPITSLSGGNQQKAVIARTLSTDPLIVLLDDPTRG